MEHRKSFSCRSKAMAISLAIAMALMLAWTRVACADPTPANPAGTEAVRFSSSNSAAFPALRKTDRKPSVAWSVISGLVTALVPMAIGGSLMPSTDIATRQTGIYVIQSGLALSPFVAHAVAGEWGRGAVFSVPGIAAIGGMAGIFAAAPDVTAQGDPDSRVPFAISFSFSLVGAAAGIIDTFLAGERWNKHHLVLSPALGQKQAGLTLGGLF